MSTEQSFFEGFVKRASEYGIDYNKSVSLWKQAVMKIAPAVSPVTPAVSPVTPAVSPVTPAPNLRPMAASANPPSEQLLFENPGAASAPKKPLDYYAPIQPTPQPAYQPPPQAAPQPTYQARPLPSVIPPAEPMMVDSYRPGSGPRTSIDSSPTAQYSPATLAEDQQMLNAPVAASTPQFQQKVDNNTLKKLMGSYNAGSKLDRAKADAIRQIYTPGMRPQDVYNNPAYQAASRRIR